MRPMGGKGGGGGQENAPSVCLPPSFVMFNGIKGLGWET